MQIGTTAEVALALQQARKSGNHAVMLTGAGCSVSAGVPSAWEITDYVRARHPQAYAAAPKHDYPSVMRKLPWQSRYALFHNLVRVAGLNWAHVGLAILMQRDYVGRLLTTNFDDLALRACALYGLHPSTHDLAVGAALGGARGGDEQVQYRDSLLREPAVLYLHGRHNGFSQKHSDEQLDQQAQLLKPAILSAKRRPRPWVIVGYSGESDPLFDAVRAGGFPGGLFWVNLKPPVGKAAKAIEAAGGRYICADADSFFLELLRRTVGGGRELFTPSLLHAAAALSALPAPGKGVAPAAPQAKRLKSLLGQAFASAQRSAPKRPKPEAKASERDLRAELVRLEGLWQRCQTPDGAAALRRTATQVEAALKRAIDWVGTRDAALQICSDVLADDRAEAAVAAASWRAAYGRYRLSCSLEPWVAWAVGRRATVVALMVQHGWMAPRWLGIARNELEALDRYTQEPSMALKVGLGDLLLAMAERRGEQAQGPGAGVVLLRQAAQAYRLARECAARCPPGDRRFSVARKLSQAAARSKGASPAQVHRQRQRIRDLSGL